MDKYKEIEDLIAFKDCICAKEILNASSMKTDIFENEVVKIDQVIIGELREHYHYIELYFYSFKDENIKNASLTFNGSLFDLRNFITKLFLPIKNPETLILKRYHPLLFISNLIYPTNISIEEIMIVIK